MADQALFIGWGEVARGRELRAATLFKEALQYFGSLAKDGTIEKVEPWFLEQHGGDLVGFFLLHGDPARLDELRRSADFERFMTRVQMVVDRLGVVNAFTGAAIERLMGHFEAAGAEVGEEAR